MNHLFNWKIPKIPKEKSNGTKSFGKKFSKIWQYLVRLSSFFEFLKKISLNFKPEVLVKWKVPSAVIGECHGVKTNISIFHDCSFGQLGVKDNKGQFEWHYTRCWEYKSISNNFIKYTYLSIHCQVPVNKVINTTRHYCHVVLCYLIDRVAWTMNIWFMLALYTCTSLPTFMKLGHMFCKIVFLSLLVQINCCYCCCCNVSLHVQHCWLVFWWRAQCLESSLKHAVFFWKKITFSALPFSLGPPLFCLVHFVVSDTSDSTWVIKA